VNREANVVGNFWVDMVRSTLYILLPLSLCLAVALSSQGVVQTFSAHHTATLMEPLEYQQRSSVPTVKRCWMTKTSR
jgi:K+-transporting ATPase ATPase A chain